MKKISDSIFYTGVNDRVTHKFENLWPLPYGVSYNSYLVKGSEKSALIDSVELNFIYDSLEKVLEAAGSKGIDYLVVNHTEPDHSGGIRTVIDRYPDIKVVGNRITIAMLKGFYGIPDEKFLEIKDGDELSLGDRTLKFITTPLVHWPETMMTYLKEERVIFSGDAFGCFGALNGGLIDDEMETATYFEEMYRYYSNIVGKYGPSVQKALEKTKGFPIDYICPTHGPVWHSKIDEVVGIYDRLSRYEGEDGVTIIYGSMYGHTAEVAEVIASRLSERGIRNIRVHNASKSDLSYMISDAFRYKGLVVGAPTYSMNIFPPVEQFMIAMQTREVKNKVMAFFGSFTWSSVTLKKLRGYAEAMKQEVADAIDMQYAPGSADVEQALRLADRVADELGK